VLFRSASSGSPGKTCGIAEEPGGNSAQHALAASVLANQVDARPGQK